MRLISFRSSTIVAATLIALAIFVGFFFVVQSAVRQTQRKATLENDVELFFVGMAGGPLKIAEAHYSRFADMFLRFQVETFNQSHPVEIAEVKLLGGEFAEDVYASWQSETPLKDPSCLAEFSRRFEPEGAFYPYVAHLKINTCGETDLYRQLTRIAFYVPAGLCVLLCALFLGILLLMLRSVEAADRILTSDGEAQHLVQQLQRIPWSNIRNLAAKAVASKGRNLHYFASLVYDTHHDTSKIVRRLRAAVNQGVVSAAEIKEELSKLDSILSRLSMETKEHPSSVSGEITKSVTYRSRELVRVIEQGLPRVPLRVEYAVEQTVTVSDPLALDRILVNMLSNLNSHAKARATGIFRAEKDGIAFFLEQDLTKLDWLMLRIAFVSGRIDVTSPEKPVYEKLWGREGRGLNIIKKSVFALGGDFVFHLEGWKLHVGFRLKRDIARDVPKISLQQMENGWQKSRYLFLTREEFIVEAKNVGLEPFFIEKEQLERLFSEGVALEIVTDTDLEEPTSVTCIHVSRKERLAGIAHNWRKNGDVGVAANPLIGESSVGREEKT